MPASTFVAMGPNAWGKGSTVPVALRNMKRNVPKFFGRGPFNYTVYEVIGEFHGVTDIGLIEYTGQCRTAAEGTFKRVQR